jgi:DNA-binding IclR family transcriptional regulator
VTQLARVQRLMLDNQWRTLDQIAAETGDPPASVSARLRDLRRQGYVIERQADRRGGDHYRIAPREYS